MTVGSMIYLRPLVIISGETGRPAKLDPWNDARMAEALRIGISFLKDGGKLVHEAVIWIV